jgi:hypothetical protein
MARSAPKSKVDAERARLFKLTSFNPIRGLTPARLATALDAFDRGELRTAALMWQKILSRDDQAKTCFAKRVRNVTGLDYEILPVDDSDAAGRQKAALEVVYNNLTAFDGLNEMDRGGLRTLIRQMMSARGLLYATHEIIWQPDGAGGLTAQFKFLPLQFFENTTGRLRFLPNDTAQYGEELDEFFGPAGWMVTTGEDIMQATSIAYIYKTLPLKSWLTYCEKYGVPGLHGKTNSTKGSPEWNAMRDALAGFGEDLAIVTNEGASITPIEAKGGATQPHPPLVERMDRAISRLWLGGDLATMSADGGAVGSQPQSDDLQKLQEDDAAMITDALQYYVDRRVVQMLFGTDRPLAYFKLKPPARTNIDRELKVDQFLTNVGAPVGQKDLLERYGRAEPDAGDALAHASTSAAPSGFGLPALNTRRALNDQAAALQFRHQALAQLSQAQAAALRPLVDRINAILRLPDGRIADALAALKADLPRINREVLKDAQTRLAFEQILSAALISGATEGRAKLGQTITPPIS